MTISILMDVLLYLALYLGISIVGMMLLCISGTLFIVASYAVLWLPVTVFVGTANYILTTIEEWGDE